MNKLAKVHCNFGYFGEENGESYFLYLGSDANISVDWNTGHFTDNFQGKWPMLNGYPVYIEITNHGGE